MKKTWLNEQGITAIEFLVGLLVISIVAVVALTNIRSIRAENRDTQSKKDMNTLAFQLETFYQKNGYYPSTVNSTTLAGVDSETFKDSRGQTINQDSVLYAYTPVSCTDTKCRGFELKAELEREAPFIKQSLNN